MLVARLAAQGAVELQVGIETVAHFDSYLGVCSGEVVAVVRVLTTFNCSEMVP